MAIVLLLDMGMSVDVRDRKERKKRDACPIKICGRAKTKTGKLLKRCAAGTIVKKKVIEAVAEHPSVRQLSCP